LTIPVKGGVQVLGTSPATFSADISLSHLALLGARPELGLGVLLYIGGLQVAPEQSAFVNVFVNNPSAAASTPASDPRYVGSLPNFVGQSRSGAVLLDITTIANALPLGTSSLPITLVPTTMDGQPPATIGVRFDQIEIRVVQQE
jgi:hypothetical protein